MKGEPGTTCTLRVNYWGGPGFPQVGDFLRTAAGSCYRIMEWIPAREGSKSIGRFICERLDHDAVDVGDPGVWEWAFWSAK